MDKDDAALLAKAAVFEEAMLKSARAIELELERVMKRGEDQLERLASRIAEVLAGLAVDGVLNAVLGGGEQPVDAAAGSANQTAALIARAVRRGTRFI
ncbi:MAG: hypothetical protein EON93_14655 [Burkholderiales bacterium]|nr:MAG: hypothetical protein EON93_14655 [Burkholderiales bacterium]